MKMKLQIRGKLLIPTLLLITVIVACIVVVMFNYMKNLMTELAYQQGDEISGRYAAVVKTDLDSAMTSVRILAQDFEALKNAGVKDRAVFSALLKLALEKDPRFLSVWTVWEPNALDGKDGDFKGNPGSDSSGRFAAAWNRGKDGAVSALAVDYEKEGPGSYYQSAKKGLQDTVTEPFFRSFTGKKEDERQTSRFAVPIRIGNAFAGVVGVDFDLATLTSYLGSVKPYETGYVLVVSNSAVRVFHPRKDLLGKPVGDDTPDQKEQLLGSIRGGTPYSLVKKNLATGEISYLRYSPIKIGSSATSWSLATVFPLNKILSRVDNLLYLSIVIGIAGFLLGFVVIFFIANTLARPIRLTTQAILQFSNGEFSFQGMDRSKFFALERRTDELGDIVRAMRTLSESMSEIVTNIKSAAYQVASGSNQVSSTSQDLSQGSAEQASSGEEVSSSMEEMASMVKQNADNAAATEAIALKAARNAEIGGKAVADAVKAMNEIAEKIGIVQEIARQTNLLALNAAIEAARAGDAGKGFAVVASEVRKLAEHSQKAAGEITELAKSSLEISSQAGKLIDEIVPDIKKTADLIQEIASSSREQNSGLEQINEALLQLDQVIQRNATSSEQLASMAEQLTGQAASLNSTIEFFKIEGGSEERALTVREET